MAGEHVGAVPEVDEGFLTASRTGDLDALLAILHPAVALHVDAVAVPPGMATEVRGAENVARRALLFASRARFARPALVDGSVALVVAPRGRLLSVQRFTLEQRRIVAIDLVADPPRLRALEVAVVNEGA